jgi:hypothetical protein
VTLQFSTAVRNAMLNSIETTVGTAAVLKIRTLAPPSDCATADTGTVLASITLASDWAAAASGGTKAWSGLPVTDASIDASGTAAHWRLYASDGTTCHAQGTVTVTGGGGDLTVDSTAFVAAQAFNVTAWTWTAPGA